jgi:nucleoside-diphosphate-sugar epimerase
MKCLVTGSHGFIGYLLVNELLKSGHTVTGIDVDYFPKEKIFGRKEAYESSLNITQLNKDIRDLSVDNLRGFDVVFHLAALPNDPAGDLNPAVTEDINYLATVQLAISSKRAGVGRFVFASSSSVYGVNGDQQINENSGTYPITPYAVSKLNSEKALISMSSKDFAVTCMRNATCYGVSPRMRFDMVLNNFMAYLVTTGKIRILSDGTAWRPLIHVEDVARAYTKLLDTDVDLVYSEIFSIGSENFKIRDLAEVASSAVGDAEIEYARDGQRDMRSYNVNFSKFGAMTGFKPKWNAKSGANELYEAYKAYGLDVDKFNESSFWAGKHFRKLLDTGQIDNSFRFIR